MVLVAIAVCAVLYVVWQRSWELATKEFEPVPVAEPVAGVSFLTPSSSVSESAASQSTAVVSEISAQVEPARESAAGPTFVVLSVRHVGLPLPPISVLERGEPITNFPFVIYSDCQGALPYNPSGYMGNFEQMDFDDCCPTKPYAGDSCIRIAYNGRHQWVGMAWQEPPNNWGDIPGGYDLSGAKKLTFFARGQTGTERAEFKMGLIGRTKKYADSARITTGKVRLSKDWRKYEMPLGGLDLSRIITGFVVVLEGAPTPTVIYIDEICFE